MTVILRTRLHIPPVHPIQVNRARLLEHLEAGLQRKLTLISAPAGFGKTTLVSAWIKEKRVPTAWFSVDKDDNDPESFWSYVIAALQSISPDTGMDSLAMLRASPPVPDGTFLTALLNEIENIRTHFVLVLDDFHCIENRHIQEGVHFLVEHLPLEGHIFLSTRADPPWSLARLRTRGEIIELRVEDLRFTLEETSAFLNSVMDLSLNHEDILLLEARTEGWIAGLQMAALSMQGCINKSGFIQAFSGSHRFILDYLVEEVLDRQPASIQEFLSKTSILGSLNAPLCDTVTGRDDSLEILKKLEKANLFLIPLDDERRWYRYHHLFADLLRSTLVQKWPGQEAELHHRACKWYIENGLVSEAVNHASAAGDIEYVAQLIEKNALTIITVYNEQLAALAGWLDTLPEEWLQSRPWLAMARAWLLAYSGALDAAKAVLQELEQAISRMPSGSKGDRTSQEHLLGCSAAIRGYMAVMQGEIACGLEWMQKALMLLPGDDIPGKVFSTVITGAALGTLGDLEGGIKLLSEAFERWREAKNPLLPIMILCELAGLQIIRGQLSQGIVSCEEALRFSNDYARKMGVLPPNIGFACSRLSYILRERNDLQAAIHYSQEAEKISTRWGQKDSMSISYVYLALALQAAGEPSQALHYMNKAKQISSQISTSRVEKVFAFEAKIHFLQGDLAFFSLWSEKNAALIEEEFYFGHAREYIACARGLLVQGKLNEANALLARLLPLIQKTQAVPYEIEIRILQALVLLAQNELEQGLVPFECALRLAEPEGYVRIFVDEGDRIGKLLHLASIRGYSVNYTQKLLNILDAPVQPGGRTPVSSTLPPAIPGDMLTRREAEILAMLATRLSIVQIADELCIAVSTLRTHIRSIYDKLGVHSRIEAAALARELKLL